MPLHRDCWGRTGRLGRPETMCGRLEVKLSDSSPSHWQRGHLTILCIAVWILRLRQERQTSGEDVSTGEHVPDQLIVGAPLLSGGVLLLPSGDPLAALGEVCARDVRPHLPRGVGGQAMVARGVQEDEFCRYHGSWFACLKMTNDGWGWWEAGMKRTLGLVRRFGSPPYLRR